MNPGDVAQSVLPLTSSDLSLFALFWQAHWLVKAVMLGLRASIRAMKASTTSTGDSWRRRILRARSARLV